MGNSKDYNKLVEGIGHILKDLNKLQDDAFQHIRPIAENLIENRSKNVRQIEHVLDSLFELVLFEVGEELYLRLLNHLETINPELSNEIREANDELLGKYDSIIEEAKELAKEVHAGQFDKAGVDYFLGHLTVVGDSGCTWKDKVVGYLHDAAEDTEYSVGQILEMLQSRCDNKISEEHVREINDALSLLNSKTSNSREEYIDRIRNNKVATRVKLNDLKHNMDISRISNPTNKDIERVKRYKKEYRTILEYLGPVNWEWNNSD